MSLFSLRSYNPVVKVLAPVPAMVVSIGSRDLLTPAIFAAVALVMLLAFGRLSGRPLLGVLLGPIALVAVMTVSFGVWTDPAKVDDTSALFTLGPFTLWSGALETGLATGLRVTSVMLLALLAGLTTDGPDLVRSMITHLRMPYRIGYAGFAAIRFVPRFRSDLEVIRLAHRVRGVDGGRGVVPAGRRWAGYAVPLLAGAIRHGDRVSLAMEARGFGAHRTRTERRQVPLRARDAVLAAWLISLCYLVPYLSGVIR
ncbi:energy-coupling factor transport system permease protein [Actinoplanes lutulentus]|uniref:Energy-coupling factor transport system permease protein n=1 Tax=Actinoplanes lutulentus TaxID=1287878 RepID=A0A327ZAQ9_9ACTN|nr:energy-coupling factor transporter transmembrane component T [Actinoplanes lutulentus]MBB2940366.1 energy-coupling factor transport system permease protein [Actinoplanes lutulentus]RAK28859.1 energy-coupling factor transport system permease protein [Actinoplanes lutulentus]